MALLLSCPSTAGIVSVIIINYNKLIFTSVHGNKTRHLDPTFVQE